MKKKYLTARNLSLLLTIFIGVYFFAGNLTDRIDNQRYDPSAFDEDQPNTWPKTKEQAVKVLMLQLNDNLKQEIASTPKDDLIKYHLGLGMTIRNTMGMWRGNTDLVEDTKSKHPDDAALIIIEELWKELKRNKKGV